MTGEEITILVIDDDPYIERVINLVLQRKYVIRKALNGDEAEPILQEDSIDLILLDCRFPTGQRSGMELLEDYYQRLPNTSIIGISAYRDNTFVNACRVKNIELIAKPFDKRFKDIVEKHLQPCREHEEHRLPAGVTTKKEQPHVG